MNLSTTRLAEQRHANVTTFLRSRQLDPAALGALMTERVGPGQLLITSSPVHGLANATSDLDFIRIQDEPLEGARISTKIFEWGEHLEVVSFSAAELAANLKELTDLAIRPPEEIVKVFRSWDKHREPRRKQTERIINGVTLDGQMPYVAALPALAAVWSRAALQSSIEQAVHLALAEAAGELRGRAGYAINTLLFLMDAILSHHGDVYTTRKWYLLRWTRLVAEQGWADASFAALGAKVERLRVTVASALTRPDARIAADYLALVREAAALTAQTHSVSVAFDPADRADRYAFLPGAELLLTSDGAMPASGQAPAGPYALTGLGAIPGREAGVLLRALRGGALAQRIDYTGGTSA
ncbi:hypothetical protein SAMN05444920_103525 [Nonomuraea solani]|uniref:Uncharacterized protein n=1 Tax=Nonomuraea solani TaxID=1144553 RepID=A0A1H6BNC8_9ACTN|nr:DUF6001 family protein [Nonomuraea solani]SEG62201.1 hypothetical protein SAMN05444920_103525 [Nonomuraea solani]